MKRTKLSKLLPQEAQILDAIEAGRTFDEIAPDVGLDVEGVKNRLSKIFGKFDTSDLLAKYPIVSMTMQSAEGMAMGTDVLKAARELGMSKTITDAVKRRLDARAGLQPDDPAGLSDRQLISVLEQKLALTLSYVDAFVLAGASAKDLQAVADGLISNIQLLKGKPTSITSVEDRRKMNELLPLLVREAKRRGVLIEGTVERIEEDKPNG